MKVVMLGDLDSEAVEDLKGQPVVVLTGTVEEIREVGKLFLRRVVLTEDVPCAGPAQEEP